MNATNAAAVEVARLYTFEIRDLRFPALPPRTDNRFGFNEEKAAAAVEWLASCGGRVPVEVRCIRAE